jgi:hypothetical protein
MTDREYPHPDTARAEAERLVTAGLAALSMAADRIGAPSRERGGAAAAGFDALGDMLFGPSHRRHSVANDSPACCRCPLCRAISAAREPDPRLAERLATGVGHLAGGAVRLLRGVAGDGPPPASTDVPGGGSPDPDAWPAATAEPEASDPDPWAAATAEPEASDPDPWAAATAEPEASDPAAPESPERAPGAE